MGAVARLACTSRHVAIAEKQNDMLFASMYLRK
jgi:hypothetical protein